MQNSAIYDFKSFHCFLCGSFAIHLHETGLHCSLCGSSPHLKIEEATLRHCDNVGHSCNYGIVPNLTTKELPKVLNYFSIISFARLS